MEQPFNVVDELLRRGFKTQGRLAAAAGVRQSNVAQWKQHNRIPHERMRLIIKAAHDEGIDLYPDDFFEPELRRQMTG